MTEGYIKFTTTEREVWVSINMALVKIVELGEMPRREKRFEFTEYIIMRPQGKNETSVIVGVNAERHSVFYYKNGERLSLIERPRLDASFEIKRVEEYNEESKVKKVEYVIGPIHLSVRKISGEVDLLEKIPPNIENPEEVYRSLEGIISCVKNSNNKLTCVQSLDDIVKKYIITPIKNSGLCKPGSYCGRFIGAYLEIKNI